MIYGTELVLQIDHEIHFFLGSSCDREITTQHCLSCGEALADYTASIYKADPTACRQQVSLKC
jgi:hypothetical protein